MIFFIAFLNVIVLLAISLQVRRKSVQAIRIVFFPALLLKCAAGIALGLIYTFYYLENDTFLFFKDANVLTSLARTDLSEYVRFLWKGDEHFAVWEKLINTKSRSLFFVKFLSVVNLFTADNYWLSSLWFSFLSFLGCWFLFTKVTSLFEKSFVPAVISFLLFPSCLLWGSGIIKECLAMAALSVIIGIALVLIKKQKVKTGEWAVLPFACLLLWNLKYYWAAICFPTILTSLIMVYLINPFMETQSGWKQLVTWILVFSCLCWGVSFLHPNFYLDRLLQVVVENHDLYVASSKPHGTIHYHQLSANWISVVRNAPWALFSGLFRPFVFESVNFFQLVISIENLFLLVFSVYSLRNLPLAYRSPNRLLIFSAIVYVVLLCIFLALSTPNWGTLSRYRTGFLPVFSFLVLYHQPLLEKRLAKK